LAFILRSLFFFIIISEIWRKLKKKNNHKLYQNTLKSGFGSNDAIIFSPNGTPTTADDEPVMVLLNYVTSLAFDDFNIEVM